MKPNRRAGGRAGESATPRKVRAHGSGTIKPSIFTLNTVCLLGGERKVSTATAKREGKPVGRRETFITTLTGLCVYSATVALARPPNRPRRSCEVSQHRASRTSVYSRDLHLLPGSGIPGTYAGRDYVGPRDPCHASHPRRERESFTLYTVDSDLRSLRSVPPPLRPSCPHEYHFVAVLTRVLPSLEGR